MKFYPEGHLIDKAENKASMQTPAALSDAMRDGKILEARSIICDNEHNLIVDLKCMRGIIPREEGALGIREGTVRDIAIISRILFVMRSAGSQRCCRAEKHRSAAWQST